MNTETRLPITLVHQDTSMRMAMVEASYAAQGKTVTWINPKMTFTGPRYETAQARQLREYAETFGIVLWTERGQVGVLPLTADDLFGRRRPRASAAPKRLADDAVTSLNLRGRAA